MEKIATLQSLRPLMFSAVAGKASVLTGSDRTETFGRLVMGELARFDGRARVLDIGCGTGLSVNDGHGAIALADICAAGEELWGCEPDPDIVPSRLLDHFALGTLEEAELPDSYFDVIYAHYVVEHVADPVAFLRKAFRILRPGGSLLFITPNERHYFVKVARVVAALRLEGTLLKYINKKAAIAHYPTRYLLNDGSAIEAAARNAGFRRSEFAYFEHGDIRDYFHPWLKWIPITLEKVMQFLGPSHLPGLVARLER